MDPWLMRLMQALALAATLASPLPALAEEADAQPRALAADIQSSLADDDEEDADEDDSADFPDDGSHALRNQPEVVGPEPLLPISPTEEKELLGDWGDSAAEAED
jgi:hypothetical protein